MDEATAKSLSWLLDRVESAERARLSQVFPQIYADIHRVAMRYLSTERASHTLTPTALVNEAFVRMRDRDADIRGQSHALALAAIAMRRILVDHARQRAAQKRGSAARQFALNGGESADCHAIEILELDDLITRLTELDPRRARVVELRFFADMSNEEIARALGVARSTVAEDWRVARAWLGAQLRGGSPR
jgi:RNA polymerase sigma factor (TIGR02999 family)